jgi:NAD(P)-dependent dehydrogenase (short-subunit alcohol dehydrogenase family)
VVTGAFGYSGRYIAERLLRAGRRVRTLTGSPDRANPFGDRVEVHPFNFDHPERLAGSLEGYAAGWLLGKLVGDVVITRDEVEGLMQGLLATGSEPAGRTKLSTWAREHAETLGRRYASELGRRRNRRVAYVDAT